MSSTNASEHPSKPNAPRSVAIVGSGPVGRALAIQLAKANYSVTISNSRGPHTLGQFNRETGAEPLETKDATSAADIIILAVPVSSVLTLAPVLQASLRPGAVVIDSGNYYPLRDGRIEALDKAMADSAWLSQNVPAPVVKAFNNIIAANIVTSARPKESSERVTLPVSGDDHEALRTVMALVQDVGFDAYNAGSLAESWRYQPGQPAYCTEPSLEVLQGLLAKADRDQGPPNRDRTRAIFEKLPANYSPEILLRVSRLSAGLDRGNVRTWLAAGAFLFTVARATVMGRLVS